MGPPGGALIFLNARIQLKIKFLKDSDFEIKIKNLKCQSKSTSVKTEIRNLNPDLF